MAAGEDCGRLMAVLAKHPDILSGLIGTNVTPATRRFPKRRRATTISLVFLRPVARFGVVRSPSPLARHRLQAGGPWNDILKEPAHIREVATASMEVLRAMPCPSCGGKHHTPV